MRSHRMLMIALALTAGRAFSQEPADATPLAESGVPETSGFLQERPSLRSRLANRRPFDRWLGRTSATQDREPGSIPVAEAPRPSAGSIGGFAPAVPVSSPPAPGDPPTATAGGAEGERRGSQPISGNPAAVNIIAGTGAIGRALGLDEDSGIRFGGLWMGDSSGVLSGGRNPGKWGLNSLAIVDLNLDAETLLSWEGASFGTQFLQFAGQHTNGLAGAFPGFDSVEASPPLNRNELYQLWFRQSLFDDKLIFRIGKSVPTYDFNNVVRPVPVDDPAAAIPAVTALAYTPIFVNPTMLGAIPGYYNSATGITTTLAPTKSLYLNYGFYNGNLAQGRQSGLEGPRFNGYYFHIGEVGFSHRLGPQEKPGNFGIGVWGQTGKLNDLSGGATDGVADRTTEGAAGMYLFGAQRLWFRRPGVDSSGVSGFYQFGANGSNALRARQYVGGGLTAFGLVPGRPSDSFGAGVNCTWLTQGASSALVFYPPSDAQFVPSLRPSQLMIQAYYQMQLAPGWFFQTNITDIPTPGIPPLTTDRRVSFSNALAVTLRLTVLF